MHIQHFFDERTSTLTYVVFDEDTHDAVVIAPVLDYDAASSKVWTESAEAVQAFLKERELNVHYILETHAHADHVSASQWFKDRFPGAKVAIGARITEVQEIFKGVFDLPDAFPADGSQFDELFEDGQVVEAGSLRLQVIYTPGHTPACVTYQVDDALFTGDALFMPDGGTGRCDFPGGDAHALYHSVTDKLYHLPDDTRVFVGHDYQPGGRELRFASTIGEQKEANIHLPIHRSEPEYVDFRTTRDAGLSAPRLLFQSVQVNVDAGKLPDPSRNGRRYLKVPINVFKV